MNKVVSFSKSLCAKACLAAQPVVKAGKFVYSAIPSPSQVAADVGIIISGSRQYPHRALGLAVVGTLMWAQFFRTGTTDEPMDVSEAQIRAMMPEGYPEDILPMHPYFFALYAKKQSMTGDYSHTRQIDWKGQNKAEKARWGRTAFYTPIQTGHTERLEVQRKVNDSPM
ncbi:MAG: hypothetical protein MHM6MM_000439 [Cercozoa sp. M6MM]